MRVFSHVFFFFIIQMLDMEVNVVALTVFEYNFHFIYTIERKIGTNLSMTRCLSLLLNHSFRLCEKKWPERYCLDQIHFKSLILYIYERMFCTKFYIKFILCRGNKRLI